MKTLKLASIIPLLFLTGCIGHRYQAVVLSKSGIDYMNPQDRQGADLKALAVNASGAGLAWVQRVPKVKVDKHPTIFTLPPGLLLPPESDIDTPAPKGRTTRVGW